MDPSGSTDQKPFISLHHISKRFGALWANQDVSLDLHQGEIHAIVGENGAGKSTLMKILNGHFQPDSGEIQLNGHRVAFRHPQDAMAAGIGMAYQQSLIFPQLTALENVIVGSEPRAGGWLRREQAGDELAELCRSVGFDLPLNAQASELAFAHRQQIEILRLLYRKVKVLILDEPTSLLSPPETERFLRLLKSLQAAGRTIIFVSHRLQEVFAIADRVSVMSRGKGVGSYSMSAITAEQLVQLIMSGGKPASLTGDSSGDRVFLDPRCLVGAIPASEGNAPQRIEASAQDPSLRTRHRPEPIIPRPKTPTPSSASALLELKGVTTLGAPYEAGLGGFSLNLFDGEVFGLGGVVGNGQRTLALLLSGMLPAERGEIFFSGAQITHLPIGARAAMGFRWLPANPLEEALLPSRTICENMLLGCQRHRSFQRYGWLNRREIDCWARDHLLRHEVVHAALTDSVSSLSGGNLQKVALSRVLEGMPRLVILEQPSRGLDIRAQERLRNQVRAMNARGVTLLLISYDFEELVALSHRIGVLYRGRMMGIAKREEASPELLGRWMLGVEAHA